MPDIFNCELCDAWSTPDYCEVCEKSKCAYCGNCLEECKDKEQD